METYGMVLDWYDDYPRETVIDPEGPTDSDERVNRGGGWESVAGVAFCLSDHTPRPGFRSNFIGFRLALIRSA